MLIEEYLLGVCPGFSEIDYRRVGSRGPASTLLFDATRITDPLAWLTKHIGECALKGDVRPPMRMGFREYIRGRRRTDTPAGDFVTDALRDRDFPDPKTLDQLEGYLFRRGECSAAVAAGRVWWRKYRRACAQ